LNEKSPLGYRFSCDLRGDPGDYGLTDTIIAGVAVNAIEEGILCSVFVRGILPVADIKGADRA